MAQVWEFHHLQWCYSIDDRVSSGVYVSREKAEAASRKPQHFSKHAFTTRPVRHWLQFLCKVILQPGQVTSPTTPSGARLVASTRSPGALDSNAPASSAHVSSRCSQLSRTRSSSADRSPQVRLSVHRSLAPHSRQTHGPRTAGTGRVSRGESLGRCLTGPQIRGSIALPERPAGGA